MRASLDLVGLLHKEKARPMTLSTGEDFRALLGLHDLTPELRSGGQGLALVRLYYALVEGIASLAGRSMPAVAAWSERELAVCARYAAVQIDRRLQANLELAASLRSC